MAHAQEHRLHSEWEQVRYIDLVLALGSDFEDDPHLAPLRAILEDPETNGQTRVMRCYAWLDNRGAP